MNVPQLGVVLLIIILQSDANELTVAILCGRTTEHCIDIPAKATMAPLAGACCVRVMDDKRSRSFTSREVDNLVHEMSHILRGILISARETAAQGVEYNQPWVDAVDIIVELV